MKRSVNSDNNSDQDDSEPKIKYKKYDASALSLAIESVKRGMSIHESSKTFNVPVNTIAYHIKKEEAEEAPNFDNRRAERVLTEQEEIDIVEWIIKCGEVGFPRTRRDLKEAAAKLRDLRKDSTTPQFKNYMPTDQWVNSFLERHPSVSFRTPEAVTRASALMTSERIKSFFTNFYEFLKKHNYLEVLNHPESFINLDESSFEFNAMPRKVLDRKGKKDVYIVEHANSKENVTTTFAVKADGTVLPTQVIFKKAFSKYVEAAILLKSIDGNIWLSKSENGWQNKNTFSKYIMKLVAELEDTPKPVFIFMDNHPSHLNNVSLFKHCLEHKVFLVALPPNSTNILQPLDVSVFGPAKCAWRRLIGNWKNENAGKNLDQLDFIKLLNQLLKYHINPSIIINGFKGTGIFPFNIHNVHMDRCLGKASEKEPSPESSTESLENNEDGSNQALSEDSNLNLNNELPSILESMDDNEARYSDPDFSHQTIVDDAESNDIFLKVRTDVKVMAGVLHGNYDEKFSLNVSIILQQLDFIQANIEQNATVSSPVAIESTSASKRQILSVPEKAQRQTTRHFKEKDFGVISSEEVIEKLEQKEQEARQEEIQKEERKIEKERKKEMQLKIRNMKKERSEARHLKKTGKNLNAKEPQNYDLDPSSNAEVAISVKIINDLSTNPPKKRGRPKKT